MIIKAPFTPTQVGAVSTVQLAWVAGFLEGEGCFSLAGKTPTCSANQVQQEPLLRLSQIFGGRLTLVPRRGRAQPIWSWRIVGQRAVEVMLTLWTFMSPKRRSEIERAVTQ